MKPKAPQPIRRRDPLALDPYSPVAPVKRPSTGRFRRKPPARKPAIR